MGVDTTVDSEGRHRGMMYQSFISLLALLNVLSVADAVEARGPNHLDKGDDLIFVHIPKTAGMSFRFTTNDAGDFDTPHTEKCLTDKQKACQEPN